MKDLGEIMAHVEAAQAKVISARERMLERSSNDWRLNEMDDVELALGWALKKLKRLSNPDHPAPSD